MMSAMVPTMIGLNEATQSTRDQEESRRNDARKQRSQLVATCSLDQGTPEQRQQVHNAQVQVGRDGKVSSVMQRECASAEPILTNALLAAVYHQAAGFFHGSFQWRLLYTSGLSTEQYLWIRDDQRRGDAHSPLGVSGCQYARGALGWSARQ